MQLGIGEGARQREASGNPCVAWGSPEISLGCRLTDRLVESCLKHRWYGVLLQVLILRSALAKVGVLILDPGQVHWLEVEARETGGIPEYQPSPSSEYVSGSY